MPVLNPAITTSASPLHSFQRQLQFHPRLHHKLQLPTSPRPSTFHSSTPTPLLPLNLTYIEHFSLSIGGSFSCVPRELEMPHSLVNQTGPLVTRRALITVKDLGWWLVGGGGKMYVVTTTGSDVI
jgi:hypothetical protein